MVVGMFPATTLVFAILTSQMVLGVAFRVEVAVEAIKSQSLCILEDADGDVLPCPTKQFLEESPRPRSPQMRSVLESMVPNPPVPFQIFFSGLSSV